jgi:hypothetical protein
MNIGITSSELGARSSEEFAPTSQLRPPTLAILTKVMTVFIFSIYFQSTCFAEDKSWNAQGDQQDWFDAANWLPSGSPDEADDAKVDMRDASVDVGQTFEARSLTVGGKKASTVSISNFVAGDLTPAAEEDEAVIVRRDGKLILKGSAGKITVKGSYKDSEEIIPEEPGFMLYAS